MCRVVAQGGAAAGGNIVAEAWPGALGCDLLCSHLVLQQSLHMFGRRRPPFYAPDALDLPASFLQPGPGAAAAEWSLSARLPVGVSSSALSHAGHTSRPAFGKPYILELQP